MHKYFVVRVRCRRKESSYSLSHLLLSFLYMILHYSWLYESLVYFARIGDTYQHVFCRWNNRLKSTSRRAQILRNETEDTFRQSLNRSFFRHY